jgi:hypothetical protein
LLFVRHQRGLFKGEGEFTSRGGRLARGDADPDVEMQFTMSRVRTDGAESLAEVLSAYQNESNANAPLSLSSDVLKPHSEAQSSSSTYVPARAANHPSVARHYSRSTNFNPGVLVYVRLAACRV